MRQGLFLLVFLTALFSAIVLSPSTPNPSQLQESLQAEPPPEPAPLQELYPEHKPVLLKSLPDIVMQTRSTAEIDLTEYFENPDESPLEFVAAYDSENLAVKIREGVAEITPYNVFLGEESVVFYANNDYRQIAGNRVSIEVVETLEDIEIEGKADYQAKELPEFTVQFKKRLAGGGNAVSLSSRSSVIAKRISWKKKERVASFAAGTEPSWSTASFTAIAEDGVREFQPGDNKFRVQAEKDGVLFVKEKEFSWGVLALNPDKNFYAPDEQALIGMAVLDDVGHMVCDAAVELLVTDPFGGTTVLSTVNGLITVSPECKTLGATTMPDYHAYYATGPAGVYRLQLTAKTKAGTKAITDSFAVQETGFDVRRTGPTRIYPAASQEMQLVVKASKDFSGKIVERVPLSFNVTPQPGMRVTAQENEKTLEWVVFLEAGESTTLGYEFTAPAVSPYLFLLGPLSIGLWSESRNWMVASDQTIGLILLWDGTEASIPAGWTCVSCTAGTEFDGRYIRGGSAYAEAGGGTAVHTHTFGGTDSGTVSATNEAEPGVGHAADTHVHDVTPTVANADNLPQYRNLTVIRYDAGIPSTLPLGIIALFKAAVPANWVQYSDQNGYYIRGNATPNSTGGSNTHNHSVSGTLEITPSDEVVKGSGTANSLIQAEHDHSLNAQESNVTTSEPAYRTIILGKLTQDADPIPTDLVGMFNATPGAGWTTLSGGGEEMDGKMLKASDTYGNNGGDSQHIHADMTMTSGAGAAGNEKSSAGVLGASKTHTHIDISLSTFSDVDHAPLYSSVIIAYYSFVPANLKIAQHRIYDSPEMTDVGLGDIKCDITSSYGNNISNGECDNASYGNLAINTMHRAEFWLCNDQDGGAEADFDYFNHNLTTNKDEQIEPLAGFSNNTGCYHGDEGLSFDPVPCTYEPDTGIVAVDWGSLAGANNILAGASRDSESCEWIIYNFTTGSPSSQVKAQSSANVTGVSSGTNPDTGTLNATIRDLVVIDVTINGTAIAFGTLAPNAANSSSTTGGFPMNVTIHDNTNVQTDIAVNGTNMTGAGTLTVRNITYSNETSGYKTELNATFTSGLDANGNPFSNWTSIPDPSVDEYVFAFWWVSVPAAQAKGAYTGNIYIRVSEAS